MNLLQGFMQHKHFKLIVIIAFFVLSAFAWVSLQIYGHYYISTDDAYINADVVQISPQVTGNVIRLAISNNQPVKKGDLLFEIDPVPFELAINSAKAELAVSLAELENATQTQHRVIALVNKKFSSSQEGDNVNAHYKTALAKVEEAKAHLAQANLNLTYTKILAPTSGWIANLTLRTGNIVMMNQPLFVIISDEEFWVDANFKETEIERIKPGQGAKILTDMYPHHPFSGVVDSISSGAGAAFSLLPPQNATGNWVKVTQRIPIRVLVKKLDPNFPLRIGTSATVTISLQ